MDFNLYTLLIATSEAQVVCNQLGFLSTPNGNKWKNHFYEMKGDVGMPKGRKKKMPTPRHKVTHNPIPTYLFCFNMLFVCLFVCYECIRQSKQHNILTSNCLRNVLCCGLRRNKDVGMGL